MILLPHPPLKLVCNVNIVYGNMKTLKIMPRNLNEIVFQEFGFSTLEKLTNDRDGKPAQRF